MIEAKGSLSVPRWLPTKPGEARKASRFLNLELIMDDAFVALPDDQKEREVGAAIRRLYEEQTGVPQGEDKTVDVEERIAGARKALELVIATLKGHADAFPDEELKEPNLRANLARTFWALSENVEKLKEIVKD